MGVQMITCGICGKQTTKRSSLLVEPFGRICRDHSEVEDYKAKQEVLQKEMVREKKLNGSFSDLSVIMMSENIRALAEMKGVSIELVLLAVNIPPSIRERVEKQVRESGPMKKEEMSEAVAMAFALNKRKDTIGIV